MRVNVGRRETQSLRRRIAALEKQSRSNRVVVTWADDTDAEVPVARQLGCSPEDYRRKLASGEVVQVNVRWE